MIEISRIKTDGGTQPRVSTHQETVAEYREAYKAGIKMPPVTLFLTAQITGWLMDSTALGGKRSRSDGDLRGNPSGNAARCDLVFAVGEQQAGLRRTNADKRKAVQTLLDDPEWARWSDHEVARRCAVSANFVGDVRKSICNPIIDSDQETARTVQRNGTTYEQKTANIGKQKPVDPEPPPEPEDPPEPEYTPLDEAMDTIRDSRMPSRWRMLAIFQRQIAVKPLI